MKFSYGKGRAVFAEKEQDAYGSVLINFLEVPRALERTLLAMPSPCYVRVEPVTVPTSQHWLFVTFLYDTAPRVGFRAESDEEEIMIGRTRDHLLCEPSPRAVLESDASGKLSRLILN